jgi:hypothetical protein
VPPDDEQISAQNMYRLLIVINCKQTVQLVGTVVLIYNKLMKIKIRKKN